MSDILFQIIMVSKLVLNSFNSDVTYIRWLWLDQEYANMHCDYCFATEIHIFLNYVLC